MAKLKKGMSKGQALMSVVSPSFARGTKKRAMGARRIATAVGVIQGSEGTRGVGRPRKSYKYGMPIQQWKKLQSKRNAMMRLRQQQQGEQLQERGYTLEEAEQIRIRNIIQQRQQQQTEQEDPEVHFERTLAETSVTPNTMQILNEIKHIQNKGRLDNIRMQRQLKEKRMVSNAMNLMKTPNIFKGGGFADVTGVDENTNILFAPSVFKDTGHDHVLRRREFTILNTRDSGNDLNF